MWRSIPVALGLLCLSGGAPAWAQSSAPPLPPLPPTDEPNDLTASPEPGGEPSEAAATEEAPGREPSQGLVTDEVLTIDSPASPPPEPKPASQVPRFAMWLGTRVSFQGFGSSFFRNEHGISERTSQYLGNGLGTEFNLGVRLERRYIPYLAYERYWALGAGKRFEGEGASAYGQFFGVGLRSVFGDPNSVAGFTDVSFGRRSVHLSAGDQSYSMSTFEFFRFSLGVEIRLHRRLVLSPQLLLSSGVMRGTSGDIRYAAGQSDGLRGPRYRNGETIEDSTSYIVFGGALGVHFDLFGK